MRPQTLRSLRSLSEDELDLARRSSCPITRIRATAVWADRMAAADHREARS